MEVHRQGVVDLGVDPASDQVRSQLVAALRPEDVDVVDLLHSGRARWNRDLRDGCQRSVVARGVGDPGRTDVRWLTGTESDAQAHNY